MLIDRNCDELGKGLHHYRFMFSLDRCSSGQSTLDHPSA